MKKLLLPGCIALFMMSCNNKASQPNDNKDSNSTSSSSTEKIDYAFLPRYHQPDNWDRGDQKNVALVLKSLKDFSDKKVDEAVSAFADSVEWSYDYYDKKLSKDSLRAQFNDTWKGMTSIKIDMDDYEAVISKDKKNEWVSLWYKQTWIDNKGKTDSLSIMDDAKIENGKITQLDEKQRHFPVPTKK